MLLPLDIALPVTYVEPQCSYRTAGLSMGEGRRSLEGGLDVSRKYATCFSFYFLVYFLGLPTSGLLPFYSFGHEYVLDSTEFFRISSRPKDDDHLGTALGWSGQTHCVQTQC